MFSDKYSYNNAYNLLPSKLKAFDMIIFVLFLFFGIMHSIWERETIQ